MVGREKKLYNYTGIQWNGEEEGCPGICGSMGQGGDFGVQLNLNLRDQQKVVER